jgi:signal transduction histidine kinase
MSQLIAWLFDYSTFTPHGFCLLWDPSLIWAEAGADLVIAIAYITIPLMLLYFVGKRRDLAFPSAFILFALFILFCGSTHILEALTFWLPLYDLETALKVLTALVSVATAVALWSWMPQILALPSPAHVQALNADLSQQILERRKAEDALRSANQELEIRYQERSKALASTTETLLEETRARQRALAELNASETQLRRMQKLEAISSVSGGMAHDFNNILGVVIGNLDLAMDLVPEPGELRLLLVEAVDAALRGAELTRSLLAFARRQSLHPKEVDANGLIHDMHRMLTRVLGEDVEISLNLRADLWPILADASQVEASLMNLCANARDAMPHGGKLRIVTDNRQLDEDYAALNPSVQPGDYVMIEVSDTGVGMSQEVLGKIFEPFFTTKEQGKGTGLGLSMVFGFAHQSRGHVAAYSEPGQGTAMRLYLPRAMKGVTGRKPALLGNRLASGNGELILVVEDNVALRRIVVRQLAGMGYQVIETYDAPSALRILEETQVDLIFSDIVMPGGMSGIDLALSIRERWPEIKVLLTSGFSETLLQERMSAEAASLRLLNKPYRQEDLASAIREMLT